MFNSSKLGISFGNNEYWMPFGGDWRMVRARIHFLAELAFQFHLFQREGNSSLELFGMGKLPGELNFREVITKVGPNDFMYNVYMEQEEHLAQPVIIQPFWFSQFRREEIGFPEFDMPEPLPDDSG